MPKDTNSSAPDGATNPETTGVYEITTMEPVQVGSTIYGLGARLKLTQAQAEALNAGIPGAVKFVGI